MDRIRGVHQLVLFILCITGVLYSIELEDLFDSESEEQDVALYEQALYYIEHPLNINTCTTRQLEELPWMVPDMAAAIVEYRKREGSFDSTEQLQQINVLKPVIDLLVLFVKVGPSVPVHVDVRLRSAAVLEESRAYREDKYRGDRFKHYNRLIVEFGDFSASALVEKDPGESLWADYYGGYIAASLKSESVKIVAGDYYLKAGQGLVFGSAYRTVSGFDPILPVMSRGGGLKPYRSSAENFAFRGVGMDVRTRYVDFTGFISRRTLDAKIENGTIQYLYDSGYHRYGNEWQSKDAFTHTTMGGRIAWSPMKRVQIGGSVLRLNYEFPFADPGTAQKNMCFSVYWNGHYRGLRFFGEAAGSGERGKAVIAGVVAGYQDYDFTCMWRNYNPFYYCPFASGYGDNSGPENESGIYWGWKWRPGKKFVWSLAVDHYSHPVFDQNTLNELSGMVWWSAIEYKLNSRCVLSCRLKSQQKTKLVKVEDANGNEIKKSNQYNKQLLRFEAKYKMNKKLEAKSRLEYSGIAWQHLFRFSSFTDSTAVLVFHDLNWKPLSGLSFRTRWTFFDAPVYDLRFYVFENDLPGVMKMPMLQNRGCRWYLLCGIKWRGARFSAKYEWTRYDNQTSIGSGYDLIKSDHISKISMQIDMVY